MVAIFIDDVTKRFGAGAAQTAAVDAVSLRIASGELFFLLGPSGCGKTTLLRMIAGFISPSEGRIYFGEREMSSVPPYQRDAGMVFQSYALWPHMTVAENVAFGLDARKIKEPERGRRVAEMLKLVRMEGMDGRRPGQLSGGQQQRVALARALAIRPQCLLLDEPLSNLDAKLRLEMRTEIRRIVKESGTTAIYVTHDQKEALSMADGIAVMRAGKLEQVGTPAELYRHPATKFVAGFVGESNFLSGRVEAVSGGQGGAVTVRTAAGVLVAGVSPREKVEIGSSVALAFRPEGVRMGPEVRAGENHISGTRVSTSYLGEMAEHWVATEGGTVKVFEMNPQKEAAIGEGVVLEIPREQVMVVKDEG